MKHFDPKETKITLLTIKQAKKLPRKVRTCGDWWWLRSPGYFQTRTAIVHDGGGIIRSGDYVDYDYNAVRPAFEIENLNFEFGEKVHIGKLRCTVIGKDLALADECVCNHYFDSKSNDWETSELKAFIESEEFANKIVW